MLIFNLTLLSGYLYSQSVSPQVVATTGDYFEGTIVSISWTIVEAITESFTSENAILTQGFQQPVYLLQQLMKLPERMS